MIDLTRLMFDDGASRPAIRDSGHGDFSFRFKGVRYIATKIDLAEYPVGSEMPENSIAFYGPSSRNHNSGMWGIDWVLADPDKYMNEWCEYWDLPYSACRTVLDAHHIQDGLVFYLIERVTP